MTKVYSKRRASPDQVTDQSADDLVSETSKVSEAYPKRRSAAKRIRNDEEGLENGAQIVFPSSDTVEAEREESSVAAQIDLWSGDGSAGEPKAYPKRRTLGKRIRNDEEAHSVSETTNIAETYPKRRTNTERIRNDESSTATMPAVRTKSPRSPMLPDYHSEDDLFICDVLDAIPKDDMASMEHPIFTLSTRPDMREIHYEHNGTQVNIWPSRLGMATIHDKDILIYCISQLVAKMNKEEPLSRTLRLKAHDLLVWSKRQTSGDGYARLINALDRLSGTRIKTNIIAGDQEFANGFGLITEYQIVKNHKTGQMQDVKVTLSDWIFRMVQGKSVLTLNKDYFRLRKPLERRIYELARKHCGSQPKWSIGAELLRKKTGSSGNIRLFRQDLRALQETNHLPDYVIEFENDVVTFFRRELLQPAIKNMPKAPFVDPEGMHDAKQVAPGYDVYALLQEWGEWWQDSGCPDLRDANLAFVGFCRKKAASKPLRK